MVELITSQTHHSPDPWRIVCRVLKDGGGRFKVEEVECSRAYRLHLVLQIQSEAPAGATTQLQK